MTTAGGSINIVPRQRAEQMRSYVAVVRIAVARAARPGRYQATTLEG
ncbi:MAG: hypothetical protein O3C10_11545 [Chloroflexi bacterium]|nr:hypothetical protein [Chloroflexota bacterium]